MHPTSMLIQESWPLPLPSMINWQLLLSTVHAVVVLCSKPGVGFKNLFQSSSLENHRDRNDSKEVDSNKTERSD
jgi:hypothetical protein